MTIAFSHFLRFQGLRDIISDEKANGRIYLSDFDSLVVWEVGHVFLLWDAIMVDWKLWSGEDGWELNEVILFQVVTRLCFPRVVRVRVILSPSAPNACINP